MKKYILIITTLLLVVFGSFSALAACKWDDSDNGLKATWDKLSTKGTLYLYKGDSYKVGSKIGVSADRTAHDFTELIKNTGPGTYHFEISDTVGRTWKSDNYQVDENMVDSFGSYTWYQDNGGWYLRNFKGMLMKGWQVVDGKWYYLDPNTGKCWMNMRTPDGYYVGSDGAWVVGQ